jgi:hypothetical protein
MIVSKEAVMKDADRSQHRTVLRKSHMPENSLFYEKVVPILLVVMGIITTVLILFAAGVLLGIVRF